MLYCLLTGRPPFQAANLIETLRQVATQEPVSPRLLNAEVDRDLETITLKCLEKEPGKRYVTAAALADDLGRYLRHEPITARPIGTLERTWRWCQRNRLDASLVMAVSILLLISAIGGTTLAIVANQNAGADQNAVRANANSKQAATNAQHASDEARRAKTAQSAAEAEKLRADRNAAQAEQRRKETQVERDRAEAALYRSEWRLYASQIAAAHRDWDTNNVSGAWQHLSSCRSDFRGWEHRYLYALFNKKQTTLHGHTDHVLSVAFSPDGKRIVSGSNDHTLRGVGCHERPGNAHAQGAH